MRVWWVLARSDLRVLIMGQLLSALGSNSLWLAVGIWVQMITGSASAAGMSFFALVTGTLFAPLGGVLVDRVRRRPLLVVTHLVVAGFVLSLQFVSSPAQLWFVYLVMFGYGLAYGVLTSAHVALVQTVVPEELLASANSIVQTAQQGLRLVAPLVGAGLLAVLGIESVILVNAVALLIAAALIGALRASEERPSLGDSRWLFELTAGIRYVTRNASLRQIVVAACSAAIGLGASETVAFAVVDIGLNRPAVFLGVLLSVQGVGAVLAGVVAPILLRRMLERTLCALGLISSALGFLLQALPWLPAALAGFVLVGGSLPWIVIGMTTLLQRQTDQTMIGRATAVVNLSIAIPQTISIALGAQLILTLDYRMILGIIGALGFASAGYLVTRPRHARLLRGV